MINVENKSEETGIGAVIVVDNFNRYNKPLRVSARLIGFRKERNFSALGKSLTAELLLQADNVGQIEASRKFILWPRLISLVNSSPEVNASRVLQLYDPRMT